MVPRLGLAHPAVCAIWRCSHRHAQFSGCFDRGKPAGADLVCDVSTGRDFHILGFERVLSGARIFHSGCHAQNASCRSQAIASRPHQNHMARRHINGRATVNPFDKPSDPHSGGRHVYPHFSPGYRGGSARSNQFISLSETHPDRITPATINHKTAATPVTIQALRLRL